ncbi:hypothetical protein G6F65_018304 [Rhizopus arrhizus]|nr:hypothetical protein G6F65_018304 [Rhizopus arrhizus]
MVEQACPQRRRASGVDQPDRTLAVVRIEQIAGQVTVGRIVQAIAGRARGGAQPCGGCVDLATHELHVGQYAHLALAMAQAREHQVAVTAPATFGLRARSKPQREAAPPAELAVTAVVVDMEWLAVAALEQAVHAQLVEQGSLRAAGIVLRRWRCAHQQVPAAVDPSQQRFHARCRQLAAVLQQHHRVARPQRHLLQVQPWP